MSALGRPQYLFSNTAIQLQPLFAQWVQNNHASGVSNEFVSMILIFESQ